MIDWDVERAKLNHDLLKNQVIPSLDRLRRLVEGRVSGNGLLEDCSNHLMGAWSEFYKGLQALLKWPVSGPEAWFSVPPLNRLDERDLNWMCDLVTAHCSRGIGPTAQRVLIELNALDHAIRQTAREFWPVESLGESSSMSQGGQDEHSAVVCRLTAVRTQASELSYSLSTLSSTNVLQQLPPIPQLRMGKKGEEPNLSSV